MTMTRALVPWLALALASCLGHKDDDKPSRSDSPGDTDSPQASMSTELGLDVSAPERGSWVGDGAITVAGEVGGVDVSLTENGAATPVDDSGAFSARVDGSVGIVVLRTDLVDGSEKALRDVRSVLWGPTRDHSPVTEGIQVRVWEGAEGLDALSRLATSLVTSDVLSAAIPQTLAHDSYQQCVTIPVVGTTCQELYAVDLQTQGVSLGALSLSLDPRADGRLGVVATIPDARIGWAATGRVAGVGQSASGTITASRVEASFVLTLGVQDGRVTATSDSFEVRIVDLSLGLPSWLDTALGYFSIDVGAMVAGKIEGMVRDQLSGAVPALLANALGDLALDTTLDAGGTPMSLHATPAAIAVDDSGISMTLDASVTVAGAEHRHPQQLAVARSAPIWSTGVGIELGIAFDLLNQALQAADDGGLLTRTLSADELGIPSGILGALLNGTDVASFELATSLPPVIVPTVDGGIAMQLGDLSLVAKDVDGGSPLQSWLALATGLEVSGQGGALSLALVSPEFTSDVVVPTGSSEAGFEQLLDGVGANLATKLIGSLGSFPLPSPGGVAVSIDGAARAQSGHIVLQGRLTTP